MSGNTFAYQEAMRSGHAMAWALKWEAAISHYRVAVLEFPEDVAARSSLATALYRLGQVDEALTHYQALLTALPDDENVLARIADIQQRRGRREAITDAFLALADHYVRRGHRVRGIQTWVKLAELLPDDLDAQERLYRAAASIGESSLASSVALTITRLRGEQASRGIDPLATQVKNEAVTGAGRAADVDQALLDSAFHCLAAARVDYDLGRTREATLGFAEAFATFQRAGALAELPEIAHLVASIDRYRDLQLGELARLEESSRPVVLDVWAASQEHAANGQNLAAIDDCFRGIAAAPDFLPLHERLAGLQTAIGASQQAFAGYLSLGQVFALQGQSDRAAASFSRAAALARLSTPSADRQETMALVEVLLKAGLKSLAVAELVSLAEDLSAKGLSGGAVSSLERAVAIDPNNPQGVYALGRSFEEIEDWQSALHAFQRASRVCPGHFAAALHTTIAASRLDAINAIDGIDLVDDALELVLEAIDDEGRAREALHDYSSAIRACEGNPLLRLCRASVLVERQQYDEAANDLRLVAGGEGRLPARARVLLGRVALAREGVQAAVREVSSFQRAIAALDQNERPRWRRSILEFHRLWGDICVQRNDLDKAIAVYSELKRLCPGDRRVHARLAEAQFQHGNVSEAVSELLAIGDLRRDNGQLDGAVAIYEGAAQLDRDNPAPLQRVVDLYSSTGRTQDALSSMELLAEAYIRAGNQMASIAVLRRLIEHYRHSDPSRALRLRERVVSLAPSDREAREHLISAYLATGNSNAAIAEANKLGVELAESGYLEEATKALRQVLQIDPWNVDAMVHIGHVCEQTGDTQRAIDHYRRALAVDPSCSETAERLAALVGAIPVAAPATSSGEDR